MRKMDRLMSRIFLHLSSSTGRLTNVENYQAFVAQNTSKILPKKPRHFRVVVQPPKRRPGKDGKSSPRFPQPFQLMYCCSVIGGSAPIQTALFHHGTTRSTLEPSMDVRLSRINHDDGCVPRNELHDLSRGSFCLLSISIDKSQLQGLRQEGSS